MRKLLPVLLLCLIISPVSARQTPEILTITIWWSDSIYDDGVQDQVEEFNRINPQIQVELRIKHNEGTGGILETLIAGYTIAPDAMPAMVLIPRRNLEAAVLNNIARNIDAWIPDTLRDDLLPGVLSLGEVDGSLYGFPYGMILQHAVYEGDDDIPRNFEALLEQEERFYFPVQPAAQEQVNDVILSQYLNAGGRLSDENGNPVLDADPLVALLTFYEQAVVAELFTEQPPLTGVVVSNSRVFLQDATESSAFPVPTDGERGVVIADGWVWMLVTTSPDLQNAALTFLEWMMRAEPLAEYTETIHIIPAQRPALRIWRNENYARQVSTWMQNNIIILPQERNNSAATQLQAAFIAVLSGISAEDAASAAIASLAN